VGDAVDERAAVGAVAPLERADDADELDLEIVGAGADDGVTVAADVGEGEVRRDLGVARLESPLAVVGALELEVARTPWRTVQLSADSRGAGAGGWWR